jgi:hypothetical protein
VAKRDDDGVIVAICAEQFPDATWTAEHDFATLNEALAFGREAVQVARPRADTAPPQARELRGR